ncbi:hypothetical protein EJ08DRAFT_700903 [Tothia fuscella]|uniref:Uncharacterized protein n=1 Tax=Tothia fuscella TaxID=1048955 RepID=A0A9P4NJK7_9PEZI|nr:hypothetical protein EJ08DRAFT_700903 [Tothia fuscella]
MVAMYNIAGRQVGSHVLAIATLGTTFLTAGYFMSGSPASKEKGPPIGASSKDEERFKIRLESRGQGEALNYFDGMDILGVGEPLSNAFGRAGGDVKKLES